MKQNDKPEKIPTLVSQALHWLDSMKISYSFCRETNMWQFTYDKTFVSIPNDIDDREIGFFTPVYYEDAHKDEETQKLVFDFAITLVDDNPDFANVGIDYLSGGFGVLSTWYSYSNPKYEPRLFKKKFIEFLDNISKLQLDFCTMCDATYKALFNIPAEILQDALGETDNSENHE